MRLGKFSVPHSLAEELGSGLSRALGEMRILTHSQDLVYNSTRIVASCNAFDEVNIPEYALKVERDADGYIISFKFERAK